MKPMELILLTNSNHVLEWQLLIDAYFGVLTPDESKFLNIIGSEQLYDRLTQQLRCRRIMDYPIDFAFCDVFLIVGKSA